MMYCYKWNVTVYSAHGQSLFKVVYGWEPSLPIDHAFSNLCDCKVHSVTKSIQAHHGFQESVQSKLKATNRLIAR